MNKREELVAMRRLAELEAKRSGVQVTTPEDRAAQRQRAAQQQSAVENDPTVGMPAWKLAIAGVQKKLSDRLLGLRGLAGDVAERLNPMDPNSSSMDEAAQAEVVARRKRDAPLMNTTPGAVGYGAGAVLEAMPSAVISGANTVLGAGMLGGLYGLTEPAATAAERGSNAGIGAITAGGVQTAANLVPTFGAAVVRPFTRRGQEDISAETLRRFATNPNAVTGQHPQNAIPGIRYTLAEATQDPGLATLERGMRSSPEMSDIGAQELGNVRAARGALDRIAGTPAERGFFSQARDNFVEPLYRQANRFSFTIRQDPHGLLGRPSFVQAVRRAAQLANERGLNFQAPAIDAPTTGGSLHLIKQALDDMLQTPMPQSGIGRNEAAAIRATRNEIVGMMDRYIPGYESARAAYANMSRPVNQMAIGERLADTLSPPMNDFTEIPNVTPGRFAAAMRDPDETARAATGFQGARMDRIMDPAQMRDINSILEYLGRREGARNLNRGAGSNTAQNLASSQLLRAIVGPLGLPESLAESRAAPALLRVPQWLLQSQEPNIRRTLARALTDPAYAAAIAQQTTNPTHARIIAAMLRNRAAPVAGVAAGSAN